MIGWQRVDNLEKLSHLIEMIDRILENCDDTTVSWQVRYTWFRTAASMCNEAAELIEKGHKDA